MSWGKNMKLTKKDQSFPLCCEKETSKKPTRTRRVGIWFWWPTLEVKDRNRSLRPMSWNWTQSDENSRRAADAKLAKSRQSVLPLQKRTDALFGWFCLCCDAFWSKVQRETPRSTTSTCMSLNDLGHEWDEKHISLTNNILGYILGTWVYRIYLDHRLKLASRIYATLQTCEPDLRSHQWQPQVCC